MTTLSPDSVNNTNNYLTHYWPITSGTMNDDIGNADMNQGSIPTTFTADRFGNLNAALNLNGGYTYLTPGYYFTTPQFSISVWIYPLALTGYSRVIDFSNGGVNENIILAIESYYPGPILQICDSTTFVINNAQSSIGLVDAQWQFLTATYDGVTANIYINGTLTGSVQHNYSLPLVFRTNIYIGKSYQTYFDLGYSGSYLDDLRFYNISLTSNQILNIMNNDNSN